MGLGEFYYISVVYLVGLFGVLIGVANLKKKYDQLKTEYNKLKTKHDNLNSDIKLLNQENFYLKQMLNMNTDSVN